MQLKNTLASHLFVRSTGESISSSTLKPRPESIRSRTAVLVSLLCVQCTAGLPSTIAHSAASVAATAVTAEALKIPNHGLRVLHHEATESLELDPHSGLVQSGFIVSPPMKLNPFGRKCEDGATLMKKEVEDSADGLAASFFQSESSTQVEAGSVTFPPDLAMPPTVGPPTLESVDAESDVFPEGPSIEDMAAASETTRPPASSETPSSHSIASTPQQTQAEMLLMAKVLDELADNIGAAEPNATKDLNKQVLAALAENFATSDPFAALADKVGAGEPQPEKVTSQEPVSSSSSLANTKEKVVEKPVKVGLQEAKTTRIFFDATNGTFQVQTAADSPVVKSQGNEHQTSPEQHPIASTIDSSPKLQKMESSQQAPKDSNELLKAEQELRELLRQPLLPQIEMKVNQPAQAQHEATQSDSIKLTKQKMTSDELPELKSLQQEASASSKQQLGVPHKQPLLPQTEMIVQKAKHKHNIIRSEVVKGNQLNEATKNQLSEILAKEERIKEEEDAIEKLVDVPVLHHTIMKPHPGMLSKSDDALSFFSTISGSMAICFGFVAAAFLGVTCLFTGFFAGSFLGWKGHGKGNLRAFIEAMPRITAPQLDKLLPSQGGYDCIFSKPFCSKEPLRFHVQVVGPVSGETLLTAPLTGRKCVLHSAAVCRELHEGMPAVPMAYLASNVDFVVALTDKPEVRFTVKGSDVSLFDMKQGRRVERLTFAKAPDEWQDFILTHRSAAPAGADWPASSVLRADTTPVEFQECALLVGSTITVVGELHRGTDGVLCLRPWHMEDVDEKLLSAAAARLVTAREPWRTSWEGSHAKTPMVKSPTKEIGNVPVLLTEKVLASDDEALMKQASVEIEGKFRDCTDSLGQMLSTGR